jgi:hypothetical protein
MKLKTLLLELDTREQKYPGINPKELVKDYKARMKKQKEKKQHKSDTNKRYRLKQKEIAKATNHSMKEFELMRMALNKVNKGGHRNEFFLLSSTSRKKAPFTVEKAEMEVLPFTKAVAAKIKAITPNRGTIIDGQRYWFLETSEYEEVKEVLTDEINDVIRQLMPEDKLEAYFAEALTIDELESLTE